MFRYFVVMWNEIRISHSENVLIQTIVATASSQFRVTIQ